MTKKSNAGRKKDPNKKMTVTLMVHKSDIVGKNNLDMEVKDDNGIWNPDYLEALASLKDELMELIVKRRGY